MANHPVPQDVEADDKLIGPFSFRQFVYLMIVGGLILAAVGLWQIFPLLAIIPAPFAIFLLLMALPLKKDQPMETYMAALFHFYFSPRHRWWAPGQRETTILITAPKKEEETYHQVSPEEASNRLSFLANVIDTEGEAINNNMNSAFLADAAATQDMFEIDSRSGNLGSLLAKEEQERRNNIAQIMQGGTPVTTPTSNPQQYIPPQPVVTAPVQPTSAPNPLAVDPLADGVLTPAEILTGGRVISSGDIPAPTPIPTPNPATIPAPTPTPTSIPIQNQPLPQSQNPAIINTEQKVNPQSPNNDDSNETYIPLR